MQDKILIGVIVVVVIGAHAGLFLWIKFKVEEGVIIKFLKESSNKECASVGEISLATAIAEARVATICTKSKAIQEHAIEKESWGLNLQ